MPFEKPGPGKVFSIFCWQWNSQLWHKVLKLPSFPITISYWDWAVARWNVYTHTHISHIFNVQVSNKKIQSPDTKTSLYLGIPVKSTWKQIFKEYQRFSWGNVDATLKERWKALHNYEEPFILSKRY